MNRFKNRQTPHGNVVLHHGANPVDDLPAFALGYHMAARALAVKFEEFAGYADYEGYPIFFLYRQALELYLKALVYKGADVVGLLSKPLQKPTLFKKHGLKRLIPAIRLIFSKLEWSFEVNPFKSVSDIERLVEEVDEIDPDSFLFRYPVTTAGIATIDGAITIDIILLSHELDPLLELLDSACAVLKDHYQALCEARDEFAEYIHEFDER